MSTTTPDVFDEQVLDRLSGQAMALYNDKLKAILEPAHNEQTLALHLDTGDYALGRNSSIASRTLRTRHADELIATLLIGPDQMDPLAMRMLGGRTIAAPIK